MLLMPPRHGKSRISSEEYPAYHVGRFPRHQVGVCSYNADLARVFSAHARDLLGHPAYRARYTTRLRPDHGSRADWETTEGGGVRAVGVGGGLTGHGVHVLVLDDTTKDRASADSLAERSAVFDWYTSTAYTRLAPGGGILLVQTRWHEDDLAGRLLQEQARGGEAWEVISYPALALEDEPHRKRGEALHPERYPAEALHRIRRVVGLRDWGSLYEQRPTPAEGSVFKAAWVRYRADLPRFDRVILSLDCSFKDTGTSFVVIQAWAQRGPDAHLIDQARGHWGFTETVGQVRAFVARFHPSAVLVEDKANGSAVIDQLRRDVSGLIPVEPEGSKVARAHAVTGFWEAGNVWLPEQAPWLPDYLGELLSFPAAPNDDQVDATTQALRYLLATPDPGAWLDRILEGR